jgi:flagellar FliL protein
MAAAPDDVTPPATATGGKRRLVLMLLGGLVLLGGAATAAYVGGLFGTADAAPHYEEAGNAGAADGGDAAAETDAHEDEDGTPTASPQVAFIDLPDIIVNLQTRGARMRFLRLRVALEVGDEATGQGVRTLIPRLLDSYQLYLRSLTTDDVGGPGGMQRVKEDLLARSNIAVAPAKVADVLLKEMLVQ